MYLENEVGNKFWPVDAHIVKAYNINNEDEWLVNSGVICDCELKHRRFVGGIGEFRDVLAHEFNVPREHVYLLGYESARMPYYSGWVYLNDDGTWFTEDDNPI